MYNGRAKTAGSIALAVTEHPKVFFLCSKEQGPAWLSRIMLDYQLDDVTVCAGANLSYEDEILASGTPAEMVKKEFPSLCVAMIKNPSPRLDCSSMFFYQMKILSEIKHR